MKRHSFKQAKRFISILLSVILTFSVFSASLAITSFAALEDSLDLTGGVTCYSNDTAYPWTESVKNGVPAVKSSNMGKNNNKASFILKVTGEGYVDVSYYVSSEKDYDYLCIYVDGNLLLHVSGESADFETVRFNCYGTSTHTIVMRYEKDGAAAEGSDCVWISAVKFTAHTLDDVASVNGTVYHSFDEAEAAARSLDADATITLLSDAAGSIYASNGHTVTLDLNGHVFTGCDSNAIYIDENTDFILTDSKISLGTGKYTTEYENSIYNPKGTITIDNAVVENTCTYVKTAKIIYCPTVDYWAVIQGNNTKIIFDKEYCDLTGSATGLTITGGEWFSEDPSSRVDTANYDVVANVSPEGETYYSVAKKDVAASYWIDNYDASGVSFDGSTYTVNTAAGLAYITYLAANGTDFTGKTVVLGNDIDLSGHYWNPIGPSVSPFKGTFDGNGKTISNMNVVSTQYNGLFGKTLGTIKNVNFENASVSGTSYTGIAAGSIFGGSAENITVNNSVTAGGNYTGGIVGSAYGTLTSCNVKNSSISCGSGKNGYFVGGIVGLWGSGTMTDCHTSDSKVIADWGVGGLVGTAQSDNKNTIIYSSATGVDIISSGAYENKYFGGLVGVSNGDEGFVHVTIKNSYAENITLPDDTDETGYISGHSANETVMENACYYDVTTKNEAVNGEVSTNENQGEAAAVINDGNAYGFDFYLSNAATINSNKKPNLATAVDNAEQYETIDLLGNIDKFTTEAVTVSKNLTVNFGTNYDENINYIVPGKGYEATKIIDGENTLIKISEIKYKILFTDESGKVVDTQYYTVSNQDITEPEVPQKAGYYASWSEYTFSYIPVTTVHPVYFTDAVPVKMDITNCTTDGKTTAFTGSDYTATFTPNKGYNIPFDVTVTVDGEVLGDDMYTYNPETGVLVIKSAALTGPVTVTATAYSTAKSGIVWTKNEAKAYYEINGEEIVYTHSALQYDSGKDVTFRVVLFPAYDKSEITVLVNGSPLEPNEDGSYTIKNVNGYYLINVAGIIKNKTSDGIKTGFSIFEWIMRIFAKIADFFKGLKG